MCKACNNNHPNCPVCEGNKKIRRHYSLDFAFEGMSINEGYDVNIVGECIADMWNKSIIHIEGDAGLYDENGDNVQDLDINDYKSEILDVIFDDMETTYNENTYYEEEI